MTDKLQQEIRDLEESHADEAVQARLAAHKEAQKLKAMFVLGGANIAGKIAASLASEAIRTVIRFQEEKLYEPLGFATFVDFLNESEYAPMTKNQFYDRKAILEKEGDTIFDLLTELGVSVRKRKLLGRGTVELDEDTVIVHDGEVTTSISLHDRKSILETISALADANAEKSIKLERQQKTIEQQKETIAVAHEDYDRLRASKVAPNPDAHMLARVELGLAFDKLETAALALNGIERDQFRDSVLEDVAAWMTSLRRAYRTDGNERIQEVIEPAIVGETLDEALGNFLDGVDLTDVPEDNDEELAAQL